MTHKEAIEKLKAEMPKNPALSSILYTFALRQRARSRLTVKILAKSMKKEGFVFQTFEYEEVLRLFASVGFGTLELGRNGRIIELKDIKVTLKSIGLATCDAKGTLESFAPRNKFIRVPALRNEKLPEPRRPSEVPRVQLRLTLGENRHLDIDIPHDMTPAEIAELAQKLMAA